MANALGSAASISAAQISRPNCASGTVYDLASGQCLALASASLGVGSCDAALVLIGGKTAKACCDAGGNVVSGGNSTFLCKVSGASCPAGWSTYQNWTTTASGYCVDSGWTDLNGDRCSGSGSSCTTGQHAFSNSARESCAFTSTGGAYCMWASSGPATCWSTITERGCQ